MRGMNRLDDLNRKVYKILSMQKDLKKDHNEIVSVVWEAVISFEHFYRKCDFQESDKIRDVLSSVGVIVRTKDGNITLKTNEPALFSMCEIFNRKCGKDE